MSRATAESDFKEPKGPIGNSGVGFPLRSKTDPIGEAFPNGLTTTPEVRAKLRELAAPLGIEDDIESWLSEVPDSVRDVTMRAPQPYRYQSIDPLVKGKLKTITKATTEQVLDLTALLTIAAASPPSDQSEFLTTVSDGTEQLPFEIGAVIAYSILRQVPSLISSCDLQVQFALVTSLGMHVHDPEFAQLVDTTVESCPDDPRPLWIRSQQRIAGMHGLGPQDWYGASMHDLMLGATEDLAQLQKSFPDSPLGWAGGADLLMDRADASEARGLRPFEVRGWRRQAEQWYATARAKASDPALLIGHARALAALGETDRAAKTLDRVDDSSEDLHAVVAQKVRILQAGGDFQGILDLLNDAGVEFPDGTFLAWDGDGHVRLEGYGRTQAKASSVKDATFDGSGGASTDDVAFIPKSRNIWLTDGRCLESAGKQAALVVEGADAARAWKTSAFTSPSPIDAPCAEVFAYDLSDAAEGVDLAHFEKLQDIQRWSGDLAAAMETVKDWGSAAPDDYAAIQRAGEIRYLEGDFDGAAAAFADALAKRIETLTFESSGEGTESGADTLQAAVKPERLLPLQVAAAQDAAGDPSAARGTLEQLLDSIAGLDDVIDAQMTEFYARSQLGALDLRTGKDSDAADHLRRAVEIGLELDHSETGGDFEGDGVDIVALRGAQESNLALALARDGEFDDALEAAEAARSRDPSSPIFMDTVAFVHHLAGDTDAAVDAYKDVLESDSSSYVSANNLAVLLAQNGDRKHAENLLEGAVKNAPEYGIAWHNLAVVRSESGSADITNTQGMLAAAARLSRDLRGESAQLLVDDSIYDSGLDISKPLAPDWDYASTSSSPVRGFALTMLILLGLRALWALGLDIATERLIRRFDPARRSNADTKRWKWARIPAVWAVAASIAILSLPVVGWNPNWQDRAFATGIVAALVLLPLAIRHVVTGSTPVKHVGWLPAIVVAAVVTPFGVAIAPFPGLQDNQKYGRRVHWLPVAAVAAVSLAFLLVSAFSAVPLSRFVATAGTTLTASMLLPFYPFDGARLKSRLVALALAASLGLLTVAIAQNWA